MQSVFIWHGIPQQWSLNVRGGISKKAQTHLRNLSFSDILPIKLISVGISFSEQFYKS